MKFLKIRPSTCCPQLQNQLKEKWTNTLEKFQVRKNNRRHLDKEIPFGEREIDCDATKTPACVADICVGVADGSIWGNQDSRDEVQCWNIQHLGTQLPIFVQQLLILHFPFWYIETQFSCLAFLSTAVDRKVESLVLYNQALFPESWTIEHHCYVNVLCSQLITFEESGDCCRRNFWNVAEKKLLLGPNPCPG